MKTKKMSLANIQGKLSRAEMKNIMAGSGGGCSITHGSCMGGVGAWEYTSPVCFSVCQQDVWDYCSTQWGQCS